MDYIWSEATLALKAKEVRLHITYLFHLFTLMTTKSLPDLVCSDDNAVFMRSYRSYTELLGSTASKMTSFLDSLIV